MSNINFIRCNIHFTVGLRLNCFLQSENDYLTNKTVNHHHMKPFCQETSTKTEEKNYVHAEVWQFTNTVQDK